MNLKPRHINNIDLLLNSDKMLKVHGEHIDTSDIVEGRSMRDFMQKVTGKAEVTSRYGAFRKCIFEDTPYQGYRITLSEGEKTSKGAKRGISRNRGKRFRAKLYQLFDSYAGEVFTDKNLTELKAQMIEFRKGGRSLIKNYYIISTKDVIESGPLVVGDGLILYSTSKVGSAFFHSLINKKYVLSDGRIFNSFKELWDAFPDLSKTDIMAGISKDSIEGFDLEKKVEVNRGNEYVSRSLKGDLDNLSVTVTRRLKGDGSIKKDSGQKEAWHGGRKDGGSSKEETSSDATSSDYYWVRDRNTGVLEKGFIDKQELVDHIGMPSSLLPIYLSDSSRVFNGKSVVKSKIRMKHV